MKKLFLLFALLTLTFMSKAQENKEYFIGGGLRASLISSGETNYTSFNISTGIGKEISSKFAFGGSISYNRMQHDEDQSSNLTTSTNLYNFSLFTRHSLYRNDKINIFANPNVGMSIFDVQNEGTPNFKQVILGVGIGTTYDISSRFRALARLGGIGYNFAINDKDSAFIEDFSSFNIEIDPRNIEFGLEYRF